MAVQFNGSQFHANNNNERRRRDGNDPALPLKNLVIILSIVAIAIGGYMVWRRSRRGPSTAAYYAAPVSFAPSAPVYSTLPDYERYALTLLGDTQPDNSVLPYASFTVVHRGNRGTYINGDNILE
eukprot:jgi/Mesvir1/17086/Mv05656-RA.1